MVKIKFNFQNSSGGVLSDLANTDIFLPLFWTKTKGSGGRGFLLLKEELISLPFSALNYGVESLAVSIAESPPNCFVTQNLNVTHLQTVLRDLVLGNLDLSNKEESPEGQRVCNQHIRNNGNGVAEFFYVCCYRNDEGRMICSELSEDLWFTVFFHVMIVINVIVVLYSPLLVPERWYREKYINVVYKHKLKEQIKLRILKSAKLSKEVNVSSKSTIKLSDIKAEPGMPKFKDIIADLREDQVYKLTISQLMFKMKADRLVPANHIPVGVFKTLYDTIIRCEVRQRYAVRDCCHSNMFGIFRPCRKTVLWHECLQKFMLVCFLPLLAAPWIIRLYFYYIYEDIQRTQKSVASESRNLDPDYPGNLLAFFNPVHGIFVFCYAVLPIDILLFGVLQKKVAERSRYVIRRCFRDMQGMNRSQAIGYCLFTLLIPIKKYGIFFLLVAWVYWLIAFPVLLLVIAFYFMPIVNIMCRLLFTYLESIFPVQKCFSPLVRTYRRLYKEDFSIPLPIFVEDHDGIPRRPTTAKDKVFDMVITLLLIISIVSFTVLALEFLIVVVEYIVYQLIGLVLNWGVWFKYATLAFILAIYAKNCFGSVTNKYQVFNEKLIAFVKSKAEEDIKSFILKDPNEQGNNAFQIDDESDSKQQFELAVQNSRLQWHMPQLVLFLDNADVTYITKHLFFEASNMPNAGCPGSLMTNLFSALSQFMVILLFLLFVLLVIAAFGERYAVSGINQTVLTAVGGILPFVFQKILFKSPPAFDLDTSSPHFQNAFNKLLREYNEYAFVFDIEPAADVEECSDGSQVDLLINTSERKDRSSLLLTKIRPLDSF
uniref:Uncharacterized protein n=1 Tax=Magallana gigas TaxID=29159 RepID=A0A8W8INV4_MAGGI